MLIEECLFEWFLCCHQAILSLLWNIWIQLLLPTHRADPLHNFRAGRLKRQWINCTPRPIKQILCIYFSQISHHLASPIGLSILCDIESNMCCTKISDLDCFSKSSNCNLHLLVHKVFLKFRCEYEIKETPSSRYIYWKPVAEVYPFKRPHYSPLQPLATDTASSRRFRVYKARFPPKVIQVGLV